MANWSTPALSSTYVTVLDGLKNRDLDAAVQFSPTYSTPTNLPTGTIRWNPTNGYWEIRDGAGNWGALQSKYMIDVDKLDGQDGAYYLAWANLTGVPSTFTPSAHTHDDRYFTETESDARFANKIVTSGNTIKLQTFGNVDLSTITVPYATNAGTVGGFSVGQNLLTTSAVTFASLTLGATAITATGAEINYLSGVTSAIQTQLNGKQATVTGGATSIVSANLTASKALVSDASGKVAVSAATATELGYLSGVTSAVQTQINAKASADSPTFTGSISGENIRLSDVGGAGLASTGHAFQIGPTTGGNLIIDANEIMARSNGATATLSLNVEGGNVSIGSATSVVGIAGTLNPTAINLPDACVQTSNIIAGAVVSSKIADGAVTMGKIAAPAAGALVIKECFPGSFDEQVFSSSSSPLTKVFPTTVVSVLQACVLRITYSGNIVNNGYYAALRIYKNDTLVLTRTTNGTFTNLTLDVTCAAGDAIYAEGLATGTSGGGTYGVQLTAFNYSGDLRSPILQ